MMKKPKDSFEKASPSNIPRVDQEAIRQFYRRNPDFLAVEIRGVKSARAMRDGYAMDAIGYVQLRRAGGVCRVVAACTPEHKVTEKPYEVELEIEEKSSPVEVTKCICQCKAAQVSCKHGLALLYWLVTKSSEPSPTEKECYWRMSPLSAAAKYGEVVRAHEVSGRPELQIRRPGANFREIWEQQRGRRLIDIQAGTPLHPLSIHVLATKFKEAGEDLTPFNLLKFAKTLDSETYNKVASQTMQQSGSTLWYELRYGRITASVVHEAAHCRTFDGSLVERIMGATSIVETDAINRGKKLEASVLKKVDPKYKKCGLFISKELPFLGASPDGLSGDFVLEVKCPYKSDTVKNFVNTDGTLVPKCMAQIQLQMKLCGKTKGLFCVASPNFETDNEVQVIPVAYDEKFTSTLIADAQKFWERAIFPKIIA